MFSTRNREPNLSDAFRSDLHSYIGGIVRELDGTLLCAGSVSDHIHLLVAHPRTCSPSELVKNIKTGSTLWMKDGHFVPLAFHWQAGYGMFSISTSHREAVEKYIGEQAEHHKRVTFQDEYRNLLKKYGIDYDEKYLWE